MGLLIWSGIGYLINGWNGALWAAGIFLIIWLIGYQGAWIGMGVAMMAGLFFVPFIYFLSQGDDLGAVVIKGLCSIGFVALASLAQVYIRLRLRGVSHQKAYRWVCKY